MTTAIVTRTINPATIAATGKARTIKPTVLAPVARNTVNVEPDADTVPTVEEFRAALAAVDSTVTYSKAAGDTLAAVTLARFVFHASRYSREIDGVEVLPESSRKDVAALVWLDATEHVTPPSAKDRTSGETSVGQYVAKFGTVATNLAYGLEWLPTPTVAGEAYSDISKAKGEAKAAEVAKLADMEEYAASVAYEAFLLTLAPNTRASVASVVKLFTNDSGREHAASFIATIVSSNGSAL